MCAAMSRFLPLGFAVALFACAQPPAPEPQARPLSSEAEMAAAEAEPLDGDWAVWNRAVEPFTLIGNIHYVGAEGVSSYLITTSEGHILLDGGFAQTAPQIARNVEALGFDMRDVKILLNSHAHFDHAAGLARLQSLSGARVVASAADRQALESGRFPYGPSADVSWPPVRVDRVIADGETVSLGAVTLTAHLTAGHTPGCTSWSMDVTGADGARHRAFFHCSATVAGQALVPESYPGMVDDFRRTFARVRAIDADVLLTNHPGFMDLEARRARQLVGDANAFVDPAALPAFNAALERAFEAELARQQAAARN